MKRNIRDFVLRKTGDLQFSFNDYLDWLRSQNKNHSSLAFPPLTLAEAKEMTTLESIKNQLIDRILATRNEKLLEAIDSILDSTQSDDIITFSSEQIEMLMMSEKEIENGEIMSDVELDKSDSEWLR